MASVRFGRLFCISVLLLLLTSASQLLAQTRDSGSLRGCVVDQTGGAVVGATVTAKNADLGVQHSATSDSSGCFSIGALPLTGHYTVSIAHTGFKTLERNDIDLRADVSARLDARLDVAGDKSTIDVFGSAGGVQSESAQTSTQLNLQDIDNTPVLGRKMSALPLLDSSIRPARGTGDAYLGNPVFVVNGNGRRQTTFAIDNSTGDDSWGRQSLFTNIPFSMVQEFSIVTNAISSEYGRTTGAAVNVVTKSGTNKWHGDLLGMWRPQSIEATMPLATKHTADSLAQGSGSISGPLWRDRTFIAGALEFSHQNRDSVISTPFAPGIFTGEYEQFMGFLRVDQKLNERNTLRARINTDRFNDSNPSDGVGGLVLQSAGRRFERKGYAAQLAETSTISPRLLNEARFQFQLGSPIAQFTPNSPSVQVVRTGYVTEGESRSSRLMNHQYQLADTVLFTKGRHNLKFGADAIHSSTGGFGLENGGGYTFGQFTMKPQAQTPHWSSPFSELTISDMAKYTQSFGNASYHVDETIWALFLQDDINVSSKLAVNVGLRYERQNFTDQGNMFAPRIGFSSRLPGEKTTVLRGSYGIFYSELRANLAADWSINGPEGVFSYTATPGQPGFPTSIAPVTSFPVGATVPARDITVRVGQRDYLSKFFDVSKLRFYPDQLLNPYTQQWTMGLEHEFAKNWIFSLDYNGQHTIHIDRPVDLNAPDAFVRTSTTATRTAAVADTTRPLNPTVTGYRRISALVSAGAAYYNGLQAKVNKRFSQHFAMEASYTWSHALSTVDWDCTGGQQQAADSMMLGNEYADGIVDQRHRAVITGWYSFPWKVTAGAATTLASARPFNAVTGVDNNGDNNSNDRPFINGAVLRRNAFRGKGVYDFSPFLEKTFAVTERFNVSLRGEAFNLLNHNNILVRNGTYGTAGSGVPSASFGTPLGGINNAEPGREFQFQLRMRF